MGTNTHERLRAAREAGRLDREAAHDLEAAFELGRHSRFRHRAVGNTSYFGQTRLTAARTAERSSGCSSAMTMRRAIVP
jgi:hypothetical protein